VYGVCFVAVGCNGTIRGWMNPGTQIYDPSLPMETADENYSADASI